MAVDISGQITIGATYTESFPQLRGELFAFSRHPDAVGRIFIGRVDDTINSDTGMILNEGAYLIVHEAELARLYATSSDLGDKICWIRVL